MRFSKASHCGTTPRRGAILPALLALALLAPQSAAGSPGKSLFERAYAAEKTEPERAIELYRRAVARGLDSKLRVTAYWKLLFLYKRQGQFGQALRMADRLGSPKKMEDVLKNLLLDMQRRFEISEKAAQRFADGLRALYKLKGAPSGPAPDVFLGAFREAVAQSPGSGHLRTAISLALVEQGYGEYASSFSGGVTVSETERRLAHAERLLAGDRAGEAEQVLYHLARAAELSSAEKTRVLYMLGRLERNRGRTHQATAFFRLAARYAGGADIHRNVALAAYALYRDGQRTQAHALLRSIPGSTDPNVRLLHLILKWQVERDKASLFELQQMKDKLRGTPPAGISPFLARRAVKLVEQTEAPR